MEEKLQGKNEKTGQRKYCWFWKQLLSSSCAMLTCLSHGLLTGYSAQALPSLSKKDSRIHMTSQITMWICCVVPLMSTFAAFISCPLCTTIGRRLTMVASCIPLFGGWLLVAFAIDGNMIIAGRAVCGVASSIGLPAAYTYVAEIASTSKRGFFGSMMSVGWSVGLVLSYIIGSFTEWDELALICSAVPVIQFCTLLRCPSSPRWLMSRNRENEARIALEYLRDGNQLEVDSELEACSSQSILNCERQSYSSKVRQIFCAGPIRKSIILCMALYFVTVFTGFSVITYHAKVILLHAKVSSAVDPNVACIIVGSFKVIGNVISALIIDRVGRKILLYISSLLVCAVHAGVGTYFYLQINDPDGIISQLAWAPLVLFVFFMVSFPIGWGSVTYVLVSELVPTSVRSETVVICNSWEQLLMFVTLQLKAAVGHGQYLPYLYWIFGGTAAVGAILTKRFLPETSGKLLENIDSETVPLIPKKSNNSPKSCDYS